MFSSLVILDECWKLFAPTPVTQIFSEEKPVHDKKHSPKYDIPLMCVDGSTIGYIPARYEIPSIPHYFYPVAGVYVDQRITPGFKYRVRRLQDLNCERKCTANEYLFHGQALCLLSIGHGYCRRLTFEPTLSLNENDNYFWADSNSSGFALELVVVEPGDVFDIFDDEGATQRGSLEVIDIVGPQIEMGETMSGRNVVKEVFLKISCRNKGAVFTVKGTAFCHKEKLSKNYKVEKITLYGVRFTLIPAKYKKKGANF